ncbi:hypothetical protein B14911_00870 [Bacillus sp. NRRL B-14911]|nr:hypothetical protein B14911_00870 [Bacillus sp. NRRL B-14911]
MSFFISPSPQTALASITFLAKKISIRCPDAAEGVVFLYVLLWIYHFYSFLKVPSIARTSPPKNFGNLIV